MNCNLGHVTLRSNYLYLLSMKLVQNFSLFFATMILLVHGLVPHYHESEMGFAEHESFHNDTEEGFLDFLTLAFHEQSFFEDLKVFSFEESANAIHSDLKSDLPNVTPCVTSEDSFIIQHAKEKQQLLNVFRVTKDISLRNIGLRAPPVIA